MNRFAIPLGVFALLVIVLAIGIAHAPDKGTIVSPLLGKAAPEFSLPSLTEPGKTVKSTDLRGRWYVFNVWGTWCFACRDEHNMLLKLRHDAVVPIIGLRLEGQRQSRRCRTCSSSAIPTTSSQSIRTDARPLNWGVYGAPEHFLVNDKGIVVYKYVGPLITEEAWEKQFLPRLPDAASGEIMSKAWRCPPDHCRARVVYGVRPRRRSHPDADPRAADALSRPDP